MVNDKQFYPDILGTNERYVIDLAAVILKIVFDKRADLFKIQYRCHRLLSCKRSTQRLSASKTSGSKRMRLLLPGG
jgi:hypothetical protein